MLLIDGVKYDLWTPPNEDEFERIVKEHAQDIFGENARYFDLKQKLKTGAGVGSIPDAYVVVFGHIPCWYIVEVELATHPLYEHIVPQITKFVSAIQNPRSQNEIVNAIDDEIADDPILTAWVKTKIEQTERHKFLANLIAIKPTLVIVINEVTEELREVCDIVSKSLQTKVVEFRTFTRQGIGLAVHAHLFEPLYKPTIPPPQPPSPPVPPQTSAFEIILQPAHIKYRYIHFSAARKDLFPNSNTTLELETDIGVIEVGFYPPPWGPGVQKGLTKWFKAHPELKAGDKLVIEVIEPMKKYRLRKA